jgi:hypothetical protein
VLPELMPTAHRKKKKKKAIGECGIFKLFG